MAETSSVIVVDDHAIFRMGVVQTIAMSSRLSVVGEGSDRQEALDLMERLDPDIALLDISMPGNGLEAAREIVARRPRCSVVMLTVSEEDEDVFRAVDLGARGYILKGISAVDLVAALETVARGEHFLSPSLGLRLMASLKKENAAASHALSLTPQEINIVSHLVDGKTNQKISIDLGISIKTVKFHITNIFRKTSTTNRVELALKANKLLERTR